MASRTSPPTQVSLPTWLHPVQAVVKVDAENAVAVVAVAAVAKADAENASKELLEYIAWKPARCAGFFAF